MSMTGKLHPADAEAEDVIETGVWYDHGTDFGGHTTSRGRVFGVLPIRYDGCDRYGCSKVVVLDPKDREHAKALWQGWLDAGAYREGGSYMEAVDSLQDALLALANPTPPIEEPQGLGAVVEDENGTAWVRFIAVTGWWWRKKDGENSRWSEIRVTRVLSEGVPAEADR